MELSIGEGCGGPSAEAARLHDSDGGGAVTPHLFPGPDPDRQPE